MVDLNEIERRARAKVLAACLSKVDAFIAGCRKVAWDKRPLTAGEIKEYWEGVRKQFQEIQPAASALEKLLREAELKGLKLGYCTSRHDIPNSPCKRCARIDELEKAHASERKS